MRTLPLLLHVAWKNLKHRPGQALLVLIALTITTTAVSLGLGVNASGNGALQRLTDATNGYHVYVKFFHDGAPTAPPDTSAQRALDDVQDLPGVAAVGGRWPVIVAPTVVAGSKLDLRLQIRDSPDSPVDQPYITSGTWLDQSPGVVLEDGLAKSLHVGRGDSVEINGQKLHVLGTAMSTTTQRFPLEVPPLAWGTTATQAALGPGADPTYDWMMIRLDNPEDSPAVAEKIEASLPRTPDTGWEVHEWQERQHEEEAGSPLHDLGNVLLLAATVLAVLTSLTSLVLVGSRLAGQSRQVGMLKVVGMTPRQATAVLLLEAGALAGLAAVLGVVTGALVTPLLANTVTTLYGGPQVDPFDPTRVGVVAGVAATLVLLSLVRPVARATRAPAIRLLLASARMPARASRLARLGLPVHVAVATRALIRRPGRLAANLVTVALGAALAVLGLSLRATTLALPGVPATEGSTEVVQHANQQVFDVLRTVVLVTAALLVVLAVVSTVITATFSATDARRNHAVLQAIGATPRQVVSGFLGAQLVGCAAALLAGIMAGRLLYVLWADDLNRPPLTWLTYAAVLICGLAAYAAALGLPARLLARDRIAATLASERGTPS